MAVTGSLMALLVTIGQRHIPARGKHWSMLPLRYKSRGTRRDGEHYEPYVRLGAITMVVVITRFVSRGINYDNSHCRLAAVRTGAHNVRECRQHASYRSGSTRERAQVINSLLLYNVTSVIIVVAGIVTPERMVVEYTNILSCCLAVMSARMHQANNTVEYMALTLLVDIMPEI